MAHTGDRAGDLDALLADQILKLPNGEGVILNLTKRKTTIILDPRVVIVIRCESIVWKAVVEFIPYLLISIND